MGKICSTQKKNQSNQLNQLQGNSAPLAEGNLIVNPKFLANIKDLHKFYVKIVIYVRQTRLFCSPTDKLLNAVSEYFKKELKSDGTNMDVACVDVVRKLHPHEYWNVKIDEKWLIDACMRQQKFSDETKVENITYEHAYPEYLQFLSICKYNMAQKSKGLSVPTKCQDVIWHSHMQDPANYKEDMIKYVGKLLNHRDDIPQQQLKQHNQDTIKLKNQLFNTKN